MDDMNKIVDAATSTGTTCPSCGRVMATPATLGRHMTRMHAEDVVGAVPVPRTHLEVVPPLPPAAYPQASSAGPIPSAQVSKKPLWKKKRFFLPVALVAILTIIGITNPTPSTTPVGSATRPVAPVLTAAQKAEAAKHAAEVKAAAVQAAAQAAAAKAAADQAAAAQAAADKAAADKAAAAQAAAAKAAAARAAQAAAEAALTSGQRNARDAAASYLAMTAFSRKGLIEQLESSAGDGYTHDEAVFGVDAQHADWNEQAFKAAQSYLAMTSFSRQGLIEQLESDAGDGYTHAQAVYGTDKAMA